MEHQNEINFKDLRENRMNNLLSKNKIEYKDEKLNKLKDLRQNKREEKLKLFKNQNEEGRITELDIINQIK